MDLNTAIPVIALVVLAYVVVFARLMGKHPSVLGPSRWMWGALAEALAVLLLSRPEVPVGWALWLGGTLAVAGAVLNWSGMCLYMGWPQPRRAGPVMVGAMALLTAMVLWWGASAQWYLSVYFGVTVVLVLTEMPDTVALAVTVPPYSVSTEPFSLK